MERVRAGYRVTNTSPGSGERGRRRFDRERSLEYLRLRLTEREGERSSEREEDRDEPIGKDLLDLLNTSFNLIYTKSVLFISVDLSLWEGVFAIVGLSITMHSKSIEIL